MNSVKLREKGGGKCRANMVLNYTWSTIYEDSEGGAQETEEEEYSYSEISESFTLRRPPKQVAPVTYDTINEDTDVEADEEFNEISGVSFEAVKESEKCQEPVLEVKPRHRRSGVIQPPEAKNIGQSHCSAHLSHCSTQCASTYHNQREKRRRAVSVMQNQPLHLVNQPLHLLSTTSEETSGTDENSEEIGRSRVRKKSRTLVVQPLLLEGTYRLAGSKNYEAWLAAVGTGPCSQDMVMRSQQVLRIAQDPDKQWRIATETVIRAKSIRGYRTNNRKWTENKFKEGEGKPELLDDWDQRMVVTTLTLDRDRNMIILDQQAEKDQWHNKDSVVEIEIQEDDQDTLIMTLKMENLTAWRKFIRQKVQSRKYSSPF